MRIHQSVTYVISPCRQTICVYFAKVLRGSRPTCCNVGFFKLKKKYHIRWILSILLITLWVPTSNEVNSIVLNVLIDFIVQAIKLIQFYLMYWINFIVQAMKLIRRSLSIIFWFRQQNFFDNFCYKSDVHIRNNLEWRCIHTFLIFFFLIFTHAVKSFSSFRNWSKDKCWSCIKTFSKYRIGNNNKIICHYLLPPSRSGSHGKSYYARTIIKHSLFSPFNWHTRLDISWSNFLQFSTTASSNGIPTH